MQLLLDTHVLYWWWTAKSRLSQQATDLISDAKNSPLVSAISGWELANKTNHGKLNALPLVLDLSRLVLEEGFTELPVTLEHATRAGLLPFHHRDPFDRILIAQAEELRVPILSADSILDRYDVKRLW
jgi:PIN domain nuclease of toxin-antitoxin system